MRRLAIALVLVLSSVCAASPRLRAASLPKFDHIVVIMLENHSDQSILGDPAAPTITQYAKQYAYAANFYGVTHPSLPNYIAITSGSNWYSNSDDPKQRFNHWNLVDELEAHHISWKAYMQGLPSPGFADNFYPANESTALYVIRHDPFMLYDDVRNNPKRRAKVVPLDWLAGDAKRGTLAQFVWARFAGGLAIGAASTLSKPSSSKSSTVRSTSSGRTSIPTCWSMGENLH